MRRALTFTQARPSGNTAAPPLTLLPWPVVKKQGKALADIVLADDKAARQVLHDYFACATTTTMSRYHQSAGGVPDGLNILHWSWDGLQVSEPTAD